MCVEAERGKQGAKMDKNKEKERRSREKRILLRFVRVRIEYKLSELTSSQPVLKRGDLQ